ncbi:MAG TPA: hypothetical protein VGS79_00560 [Puia sp.]|nr:hypothetical protein [Puia sp.]
MRRAKKDNHLSTSFVQLMPTTVIPTTRLFRGAHPAARRTCAFGRINRLVTRRINQTGNPALLDLVRSPR